MKKLLLLPVIIVLLSTALFSCKEYKKIDMETQVPKIEDGVPKIIPGVATIHTYQDDDYTKVKLIIGSESFYNAGADEKQAAAIKAGQLILNVLGPDNNLFKGTLIITENISDRTENPTDGINIDMKIDSLRKVAGK
jgi:hypothetical protein